MVKSGTADAADAVPVGTGAFRLSADGTVTENSHAVRTTVQEVRLVHIQDAANIGNALAVGNIDYVFSDFANGEYTRIVAQNTFVTMNNLVYLGINSAAGALRSSAVRTAIYYAADKDNIAASAFRGCAQSAALSLQQRPRTSARPPRDSPPTTPSTFSTSGKKRKNPQPVEFYFMTKFDIC